MVLGPSWCHKRTRRKKKSSLQVLKDWTRSQMEGYISPWTFLCHCSSVPCLWREFYVGRSCLITQALMASADLKRISDSSRFPRRIPLKFEESLITLVYNQGWISLTSGPLGTHREDIKISPDPLKSVAIRLKSFKSQLNPIWPLTLKLGEMDEWFIHNIHLASYKHSTHLHRCLDSYIYIYIYIYMYIYTYRILATILVRIPTTTHKYTVICICTYSSPASWGCRIHRLFLCRRVRLPQRESKIWH